MDTSPLGKWRVGAILLVEKTSIYRTAIAKDMHFVANVEDNAVLAKLC